MILSVALYRCEIWSFTSREEKQRLKSVLEQGTEENIWTEEGQSDRILEKTE
jgi:hypothetical protein